MSLGKIVIVGGGIVGLTSAYYLKKDGWDVTVLDRENFDNSCSYGNAGMLVPSHFTPLSAPGIVSQGLKWLLDSRSPFYIRPALSLRLASWGLQFIRNANEEHVRKSAPYLRDLNLMSSSLYDELAVDLGSEFDLHQNGILFLYKTQKTQDEELELAEEARKLGLDAQPLTPKQLEETEPDVKLDVLGAIHYKCDGHLYPPALMNTLISQLKKEGVRLEAHAEVVAVHSKEKTVRSVETADGRIFEADQFVFASGAWLEELSKLAGHHVPVMPGKGYSFMTDKFKGKVRHPSLLLESKVALTPMGGKVRIGGTMELGPAHHKINPKRVEGIIRSVPQYYSGYTLDFPEEKDIWHGFRPCSPDGLPYLGKPQKTDNLIIAGGLGMMGLSLGPAVGKTVADLASGRPDQWKIFSPDRFN